MTVPDKVTVGTAGAWGTVGAVGTIVVLGRLWSHAPARTIAASAIERNSLSVTSLSVSSIVVDATGCSLRSRRQEPRSQRGGLTLRPVLCLTSATVKMSDGKGAVSGW